MTEYYLYLVVRLNSTAKNTVISLKLYILTDSLKFPGVDILWKGTVST